MKSVFCLGAVLLLAGAGAGTDPYHGAQRPLTNGNPGPDGPGQEGAFAYMTDELHDFIREMMKKWHVPGMAVGIVDGNNTYTRGFGYASLNSSTPVTPDTLFYMGSTTKSFTAAALSLLVDEANASVPVSFDTPVSSLMRDEFVLSDDWATAHITIEDALSHRTGYPRHDLSRHADTAAQSTRNLRNLPMAAEPRTKFLYCNLMFGAMGHLISVLSGSPLVEFLRERLWEPWNMHDTCLGIDDVEKRGKLEQLAEEYFYNNDTEEFFTTPHVELNAEQGAGAVISNVKDYTKYLRAMMDEAEPISKAGHAALKSPRSVVDAHQPPFTGPIWYGLGWFSSIADGEQIWFHSGQVNQFISNMLMIPSRKFAIVTTLNAVSIAQDVIYSRIVYDFLGVPQEKRFDVETARSQLVEQLKQALATCTNIFYPDLASPPLPLPLPLANFTGSYYDPGYGAMTLSLDCGERYLLPDVPFRPTTDADGCRLVLTAADRGGTRGSTLHVLFEHKSGDHWLGWAFIDQFVEGGYERPVWCVRAQFKVDVSGVVKWFGIDARLEGRESPLTWLERVEDGGSENVMPGGRGSEKNEKTEL